jgi:exodeoxyribonuclease VIII
VRERILVIKSEPRLTHAEYEAIEALNWSKLKWLSRSPAHYLHNLLHPGADTAALKRGRAVHVASLEPERFGALYVVWGGGRRQGKDWERFEAAAAVNGQEVLTESEYEQMKSIAIAVRSDAIAARYVTGVRTEQVIRWTYRRADVDGVGGYETMCKGRLDAVGSLGVVDLKTARDGSPSAFGREVLRLEYHVQAAWYVDGYKAATGRELPWSWVVVEAGEPHVVQVYRADEETLQLGRERYRELLDLLHACGRNNAWPGYATSEMTLQLPKWAWPQDEDATDIGLEFGQQTQEA